MTASSTKPCIPGYRILCQLGAGGGGVVYRAIQEGLDREVALKVLHEALHDDTSTRRFIREAQLLSRISHPNVVRVLTFGGGRGNSFIAMELLQRGTLRSRLDACARLDPESVLRLADDLLRGLSVLHEMGVVHRDVKPSNIFFRDRELAVLGDFGLARTISTETTQLTSPGALVGTLAYLPPESYRSDLTWGPTQDLFALGVTLHEAITGSHPTEFRPFSKEFRPPDLERLGVMGPFVTRCLEPSPVNRPASAKEALALLPAKRSRDRARLAPEPSAVRERTSVGGSSTFFVRRGVVAVLVLAAGLTAWKWFVRASATPALIVRCTARSASVEASGTGAMWLAVRDVHGKVIQCLRGNPEGSQNVFEIGGLEPGTQYVFQSLDAAPEEGRPAHAEVRERTLPAVTVLGVDGEGTERLLWLTVQPSAMARWRGASQEFPVGPGGSSVPVSPAPTGAPAVLDIIFDPTWIVSLAFDDLPGELARSLSVRLPEVGVILAAAGRCANSAGPRQLSSIDGILEDGPGWVAFRQRGRSPLAIKRRLVDDIRTRFGSRVALLTSIGGDAGAETSPWIELLARPDETATKLVVLAFLESGEKVDYNQATAAAWDRAIRWRLHIGSSPDGPEVHLGLTSHYGMERICSILPDSLRPPHAVAVWPFKDDGFFWKMAAQVLRVSRSNSNSPRPRWVVIWFGMEPNIDFATEAGLLSFGDIRFSRMYVLSRMYFPSATVLVDFGANASAKPGELLRAWHPIRRSAQALAGLTIEGSLATFGTAVPRFEGSRAIVSGRFADSARRVQVMMTEGAPVSGTFFPRRPGVLVGNDPARSEPAESVSLTTAPMAVVIRRQPSFFREFSDTSVRALTKGIVEVITVR